MKLSGIIKEKIAQTIAAYFTTQQIVNVFSNANIPTNVSLFAKWKITLDAFGKISDEEGLFYILNEFCHPLNFVDSNVRIAFIEKLKEILSFENIEIQSDNRKVNFYLSNYGQKIAILEPITEQKTSTDYIVEAINFFKEEYNKARMSGLIYEYSLGENINSDQVENGKDDYDKKLKAIEQLKKVGFITEYKISNEVENDGYYIWDYAVCKIDESKITQKESPKATDAGVNALTQKIIHEHTHRFENSIQIEKQKENPLSITKVEITNLPELKIKGFEEKVILSKPKNKKIQLRSFPKDLKWEDITIQFLNGHEVIIKAKNETLQADYEIMGFKDEKKKLPNNQWVFLKLLSTKNGEISWDNNQNLSVKKINSVKKTKQLLTEALKAYFQINNSEPFYDYKTEKSYKIKINLTPEVDSKNVNDQEIYN